MRVRKDGTKKGLKRGRLKGGEESEGDKEESKIIVALLAWTSKTSGII